jgi:hypothetical protein
MGGMHGGHYRLYLLCVGGHVIEIDEGWWGQG